MRHALDSLRPILAIMLSEHRGKLLSGALLAATTVLCGMALLGISGWFITATAIAGLTTATALVFDVFAPSAGIRFFALARTASRYGERLVTHDATLRALAGLRETIFRGWAGTRAAGDLLLRPSKLLFRITQDVDALDSLYLRVLVPAGAAIVTALAAGILLGLIHPLLGLGVAAVLIAAALVIPAIAARAAEAPGRRRAHAIEALRARTIDLVKGQTDLAMAGRLAAQSEAITMADRRAATADDSLHRIDVNAGAAFGIVGSALLAGTLCAVSLLATDGMIAPPVAAFAVILMLAAIEPFAALRRGALELGRTVLAARRISPRLASVASRTEPGIPASPPATLRMASVSVRRTAAGPEVLRDISLTLGAGEHVAVIGPSGSGKSTLLALMAGELTPDTGSLERSAATLLTQRTELFADTLRDNLRLALPGADDARLGSAIEAAGLARYVAALPQGLDTRLGEGGQGLSGGEARRLALARLFLRDTPVWLLDEPTEGLDGTTARDVIARLKKEANCRALVLATHTRREAEAADRLIVMDDGAIVATAIRGTAAFDAALAALRPD